MNFSFLICSIEDNKQFHEIIINSIKKQNIPQYEILCCGYKISDTKHIEFDELQKTGWITKKKNLLVQNAKYENVVLMHDYIELKPDWHQGYVDFGNNFNVCINPIYNQNYSRFRDWTLWAEDAEPIVKNREFLLPYDETTLSKWMYISGAYFVAKKDFMTSYPLNENLLWGESEDVEWSKRVRNITNFSINQKSSVRLLKQKWMDFNVISEDQLKNFKMYK